VYLRRHSSAITGRRHIRAFARLTNIDDAGRKHGTWLRAHFARKTRQKARHQRWQGHIIKDVENIQEAIPGQDLVLTIDERIQYLAYRELQTAVLKHKAIRRRWWFWMQKTVMCWPRLVSQLLTEQPTGTA